MQVHHLFDGRSSDNCLFVFSAWCWLIIVGQRQNPDAQQPTADQVFEKNIEEYIYLLPRGYTLSKNYTCSCSCLLLNLFCDQLDDRNNHL